jgi:outer membrane receptor protein involved in Fe transport
MRGLRTAPSNKSLTQVTGSQAGLLGSGDLQARVNWRYDSRWWADYVHNRGTEQLPDNKFDATLTYQAADWSVGLWIKNLTNRAVMAATAAAGIGYHRLKRTPLSRSGWPLPELSLQSAALHPEGPRRLRDIAVVLC